MCIMLRMLKTCPSIETTELRRHPALAAAGRQQTGAALAVAGAQALAKLATQIQISTLTLPSPKASPCASAEAQPARRSALPSWVPALRILLVGVVGCLCVWK